MGILLFKIGPSEDFKSAIKTDQPWGAVSGETNLTLKWLKTSLKKKWTNHNMHIAVTKTF